MPRSQHFFFTPFICMALFGAARAIKKYLFWVEKLTPLRRGESPAACRGGGGPLIRNAQQYLNFATFGSHLPTFTQGKCQAAHQMSGMSDILQYIAFFSFPFFFVPFFFFPLLFVPFFFVPLLSFPFLSFSFLSLNNWHPDRKPEIRRWDNMTLSLQLSSS